MDIQSILCACTGNKKPDDFIQEEDDLTDNFGSEELALTDSRQTLSESGTVTTARSCKYI